MTILQTSQSYSDYIFKRKIFRNGEIENFLTMSRCFIKCMKLNGWVVQIINVYNQEYESAAAFWPDVHGRIVVAQVVSQLLLMGLLSTKEAAHTTPFLISLPIITIWFHRFCKGRYESAFKRYPLQVCQILQLAF